MTINSRQLSTPKRCFQGLRLLRGWQQAARLAKARRGLLAKAGKVADYLRRRRTWAMWCQFCSRVRLLERVFSRAEAAWQVRCIYQKLGRPSVPIMRACDGRCEKTKLLKFSRRVGGEILSIGITLARHLLGGICECKGVSHYGRVFLRPSGEELSSKRNSVTSMLATGLCTRKGLSTAEANVSVMTRHMPSGPAGPSSTLTPVPAALWGDRLLEGVDCQATPESSQRCSKGCRRSPLLHRTATRGLAVVERVRCRGPDFKGCPGPLGGRFLCLEEKGSRLCIHCWTSPRP